MLLNNTMLMLLSNHQLYPLDGAKSNSNRAKVGLPGGLHLGRGWPQGEAAIPSWVGVVLPSPSPVQNAQGIMGSMSILINLL